MRRSKRGHQLDSAGTQLLSGKKRAMGHGVPTSRESRLQRISEECLAYNAQASRIPLKSSKVLCVRACEPHNPLLRASSSEGISQGRERARKLEEDGQDVEGRGAKERRK